MRAVCLALTLLAALPEASARPRPLRAVGLAVRSEALRMWRGVKHRSARRKVARALKTLDAAGLRTRAPIQLVSGAERRLHGSLIQEARNLRGARPGTLAHLRLRRVKQQLEQLSAKRRLTRGLPDWASARTDGKTVTVNADLLANKTLTTLAHELRHVKDRRAHPKDYNERELVIRELWAHRAEGLALGASGRPLRALHYRSPTGDRFQDARYPPGRIGKATAHGYIIGVKRALARRIKGAKPAARALAEAYLRGYRDQLIDGVKWAAKNPPPEAPKGTLPRLRGWLSWQKYRATRALKAPGLQREQRAQRIGTVAEAREAGQRDAGRDLAPHARLKTLLAPAP